jgi:hypothetical protein
MILTSALCRILVALVILWFFGEISGIVSNFDGFCLGEDREVGFFLEVPGASIFEGFFETAKYYSLILLNGGLLSQYTLPLGRPTQVSFLATLQLFPIILAVSSLKLRKNGQNSDNSLNSESGLDHNKNVSGWLDASALPLKNEPR